VDELPKQPTQMRMTYRPRTLPVLVALVVGLAGAGPASAEPLSRLLRKTISSARFGDVIAIPPPKELYHWLSRESLGRLDEEFAQTKRFPLKKIDPNYNVALAYRETSGWPALFAWSNPVTGIAAGGGEVYGGGERLLKLWIASNVKAALVVSDFRGEPHRYPKIPQVMYDLVLHFQKAQFGSKY
jgi:hypothetical protein